MDPLPVTLDSLADFVASRVRHERGMLAARWLHRLCEFLHCDPNEVFPGRDLLDHIPGLLDEIATYIRAPEDEEIAANAAVVAKARELGLLRHRQQASLHQVIREFEILAEVVEHFIGLEIEQFGVDLPVAATMAVVRRYGRAVRALMRTTVEAFIEQYTTTIEEQGRRLDGFVRMISHELRTPIGTLLVASKLLDTDGAMDEARRRKALDAVYRNAEKLAGLVQQLERIGVGQTALDLPTEQTIDIRVAVREVFRQLRTTAEERDVRLVTTDQLPTRLVDPGRLELILMNLVSNAIKYSDPAKSDRRVEIAEAEAPPGFWAIGVSDNGLGIAVDAQRSIFDRFVRAHADRDRDLGTDGLGLGLAIVRECVEAMGGLISFDSQVGVGTTFTLRFPVKD